LPLHDRCVQKKAYHQKNFGDLLVTGLLLLGFYALYYWISYFVVILARKAGKTPRKKMVFTIIAGLIMYNLLFWELIPTIVMYNYYVRTQSGFRVYKTAEQWKDENPEIVKSIHGIETEDLVDEPKLRIWRYNNAIGHKVEWSNLSEYLPIHFVAESIIDLNTMQPLMERQSVYCGYDGLLGLVKLWLNFGNKDRYSKEFYKLMGSYI